MGSCAAPSAKGDDKFITTDYLQQCPGYTITREDLLVAATLLAQNLFTHGYALGKL